MEKEGSESSSASVLLLRAASDELFLRPLGSRGLVFLLLLRRWTILGREGAQLLLPLQQLDLLHERLLLLIIVVGHVGRVATENTAVRCSC